MKIKRLSIVGFKSFMDKLAVDFPSGISGIVGPNGCGKSNIVDAIRWCLGEQSPKQLRGRQMEDVIFGGSGGYKPLGMAEVSLLFENGHSDAAPGFSQSAEIYITRRLYRSGESEYLINNAPCRLKDIQELFMDTGLGNRAYSIIGQGRIGAILEQRPEETRIMLEEAAGITKYRRKAEMAQRKMEQTESNLQRVEDILGEIRNQMSSLKRQAAKARRYKTVTDEIRRLELTLYANTYHRLQEASGTRQKSTEALLQKELAQATELSSHEARLESLNLELDEKDNGLTELRSTHERLLDRMHRKESKIEALSSEIRMQQEMEQRLVQEKEHIEDRLSHLQEENDGLDARIDAARNRFEELEENIAVIENRCRSKQAVVQEVREEYEKARTAVAEGVNQETGLSHESQYLNKMLGQITDGRSRLERERLELQEKTEKILQASEMKVAAREAVQDRLRETDAALEEKTDQCEELERVRGHVQTELRSAEMELGACSSRLSSLETLTSNFEGYKQGVRAIMKATDLESHREGRIMGLVADMLQVNPRYEPAVEAVMSDQLQSVIVQTQEDGKHAVDYLKGKSGGRSSFVPLRDLNGNGGPHSHASGPYPLLRDLIQVPDEYRPVLHALLADAMVVDSLEEALAAWRGNGRDQCLVTLEGDMVDRRGIISGGRLARRSSGILARKREIKELREKSVRCQSTVSKLHGKLEMLDEEIEREKHAQEDLREERWSAQDEINELDKLIFRLSQEMDQQEKLAGRISQELDAKDKEERKQKGRLSELEEAIGRCKARRVEEQEYLLTKQQELKQCEEDYEAVKEELTRLKADHRILQEEQRGLVREKQRLVEYAEESRERTEHIRQDIHAGHERIAACETRKESLARERLELSRELEKAQDTLNRAERERQEFQTHIREVEQIARKMRDALKTLRDDVNRAKMEESELRFNMDGLIRQVREKFDLDLREVCEQHLQKDFSAQDLEKTLEEKRESRRKLGEVNLTAIKEHEALEERHDFIQKQKDDLVASIEALRKAIRKINKTSLEKFTETLAKVDGKLKDVFPILFNGGSASLKLTDEDHPLESGVLVEVRPPGKKLSHMGLLSGGEKALVAMALLFAIYMIKPSPFCLLDEVDAPLDEANIDRFNDLLKEIRRYSQIIMVTHNRRTMEISDRLYGITMENKGVSKIVSVDINGNTPAHRGTPVIYPPEAVPMLQ